VSPSCYSDQSALCENDLRLEAVICCVGFDDLLDFTLGFNHAHFDTLIVVTAHRDKRSQAVARKHGCLCVQTDLFKKNGRNFNKGAAINAGMHHFQYHGWRAHLDADIIVPDSFRRLLFNNHHLDKDAIYGTDRVDVIGLDALRSAREQPQHLHNAFINASQNVSPRYVDALHGWLPLGFFQLWHARCQKQYPYSLGTAAHDDVMFSASWPRSHRRLLPGVIVYHLCARKPVLAENWDGHRRQPRLKRKD
jgi:hypothetical protein